MATVLSSQDMDFIRKREDAELGLFPNSSCRSLNGRRDSWVLKKSSEDRKYLQEKRACLMASFFDATKLQSYLKIGSEVLTSALSL